jgi:transposase
VWSPGEHLVIDWGTLGGVHVLCAVLAWSRIRFARFAADERAETTMAMLAECFEVLGGVPGKVLAGRMGCLKGGGVANVAVPAPGYVRFAAHSGSGPISARPLTPKARGLENLVGYAKADLMVPHAPFGDLAAANAATAAWCAEVNAAVHSEICAVPPGGWLPSGSCWRRCRRIIDVTESRQGGRAAARFHQRLRGQWPGAGGRSG